MNLVIHSLIYKIIIYYSCEYTELPKNLMDSICNLENLNFQFHFIVLSEIWGTFNKAKLNIIQGYNHLYDTREQRNGGGIAIYVQVNIAYKKATDLKLDKTYFE